MDAAAELGRNPVGKHQIQPEYGDQQADAGRTAESVSRDQILRRERGQGNIYFPCPADHMQDWQPYPVDPYSCYMCDHTYWPGMLVHKTAYATVAPKFTPSIRDILVDINDFHVAHAYSHKVATRKATKQMGVTLEGELHECKGGSMAKGIRMSIPTKYEHPRR